jgi:hypothetical protein
LHLGTHILTQPRAREKREQGGTAASINQQFQSRSLEIYYCESGEVRGALLIGAERARRGTTPADKHTAQAMDALSKTNLATQFMPHISKRFFIVCTATT